MPELVERVVFVQVGDPLRQLSRSTKIAAQFALGLVQEHRQMMLRDRQRLVG